MRLTENEVRRIANHVEDYLRREGKIVDSHKRSFASLNENYLMDVIEQVVSAMYGLVDNLQEIVRRVRRYLK